MIGSSNRPGAISVYRLMITSTRPEAAVAYVCGKVLEPCCNPIRRLSSFLLFLTPVVIGTPTPEGEGNFRQTSSGLSGTRWPHSLRIWISRVAYAAAQVPDRLITSRPVPNRLTVLTDRPTLPCDGDDAWPASDEPPGHRGAAPRGRSAVDAGTGRPPGARRSPSRAGSTVGLHQRRGLMSLRRRLPALPSGRMGSRRPRRAWWWRAHRPASPWPLPQPSTPATESASWRPDTRAIATPCWRWASNRCRSPSTAIPDGRRHLICSSRPVGWTV